MAEFINIAVIVIISVIALILLTVAIYKIRELEPYPFCKVTKDISNRRNMNENLLIEECLLDENVRTKIFAQKEVAIAWKKRMIEEHPTQETKIVEIFNTHNENDILFIGYRQQTRYRQSNYRRYAYQVDNIAITVYLSLTQCKDLILKLKKYNFEATLQQINSQNQRKLLTPSLRQEIKERDDYTCVLCGKYMPDEIGLHIDHIIPIKNGGKSIPSNLQVLCSKCNAQKGTKGIIKNIEEY